MLEQASPDRRTLRPTDGFQNTKVKENKLVAIHQRRVGVHYKNRTRALARKLDNDNRNR